MVYDYVDNRDHELGLSAKSLGIRRRDLAQFRNSSRQPIGHVGRVVNLLYPPHVADLICRLDLRG